jgi:hypothetical protein
VFPDTTSGNCAAIPAGKGLIAGWNKGPTGAYQGAGTNIAAFAAQAIAEFASYRPGNPPKGLTFTNTAGDPTYGGAFDGVYCIDNNYYPGGDVFVTPDSTGSYTGDITTTGNIYISNLVTTINGIFTAKGNIYTCATATGAPVPAAQMKTSCTNQLTINGAFTANTVFLQRVAGSVSSTPAEQFNFGPEVWLPSITTPTGPGPSSINLGNADSVTSLPPVL